MTANNESPESGKNAPESIATERLAAVGQSYLAFHLQDSAAELHTAFNEVAGKVDAREELTERDVRSLDRALDDAREVVDHVAHLADVDNRSLVDVMSSEEIQQFAERLDQEERENE